MKKIKVLVFPCGSEIGLEIHNALKNISFVTLVGASSVNDHGKFVYRNYFQDIPFVNDKNFIEKINKLCIEKNIDYIFPAMDEVILKLSENREKLKSILLSPPHKSVDICRSKQKTYDVLEGLYFCPKVYKNAKDIKNFPVIIKPNKGYGSKGFKIINSKSDLEYELSTRNEEQVICEYLSGDEYTIDCFTDKNNNLKYCASRCRNRVRNGISVNSTLEPYNQEIIDIALGISNKIIMRGAWFFQLKKDDSGNLKLLEVATRVAGTMCVERAVGVNMPLLTIFDAMNIDVTISTQFDVVEVDRALSNKYNINKTFEEVYIDYDDTIIVHGKINLDLIRYLYQCVNDNTPITLITKHCKTILEALKENKISESLFDKIIHLTTDQKKCDFIFPKDNALFIDDSYMERKQMQEKYNITAIGVDCIEILLDFRQ